MIGHGCDRLHLKVDPCAILHLACGVLYTRVATAPPLCIPGLTFLLPTPLCRCSRACRREMRKGWYIVKGYALFHPWLPEGEDCVS